MTDLNKIVALLKRRGFIFPASEIYGGMSGFYDWGHLGNELKFNLKQLWWQEIVKKRDDVFGISSTLIMPKSVWFASGHLQGFSDNLVECTFCHKRFKLEEISKKGKKFICLNCEKEFEGETRAFNLMFKTFVGAIEDENNEAFLRPETAAGIFVNFKNFLKTYRIKLPFGIAQIGKSFRNEINPRDFIFRLREFEQMELEYFVKPEEAEFYFNYWVKERLKWYQKIGLKSVRLKEQTAEERAHYSKGTIDFEYKFPFGWQEIEGVANRGNFDLKQHMTFSKEDLTYFDEETKQKFIPYVIEPSAGVERIILAVLCESYTEDKDRIILKLPFNLAPYKVAVFPLLANKEDLVRLAKEIYLSLKEEFEVYFDNRGNIGKRYYAQDEIGTPFSITVDFESLKSNDVTIRDRDTTKQIRIKIDKIKEFLKDKLIL